MRPSRRSAGLFVFLGGALSLAACGGGGGGVGPFVGGGAVAAVLTSVAPEPALPAGVDPVPALSPTPMRLVGTGLPVATFASTITVRLTAATSIFADGTSTTVDVAATASTATTLDFVTPLATLSGVDTATVDLAVGFPEGGLATLPAAFTYQAPALAVVSTNPAGGPGATGIANANLDATGGRPLHLFARGGGDPFVLSPAAGRTFGPLPVPVAGTVGGVVDVEFRTAGLALWPGNAEFAIALGTLVSDGTTWLVRGSSPGLLDALPAASTAPVDAIVSLTFEDGTRQTLPDTGSAPGAQLVRTSQRLFTSVGGLARAFGQAPFVDGLTAFVAGAPAGAGPIALDAARNRLYVATGPVVTIFDTAQTLGAGPAPVLGPVTFAPGAPSPSVLAFAGGALTGMAVDEASGRVWVANDVGVQVADPFQPGAPFLVLTVPPGLGATNHAQRVLSDDTSGEMVVSLFDGAGAGTEALLVYDAARARLTSVWRVGAMLALRGTIAANATSLGAPTQQVFGVSTGVSTNLMTNNLPAATGALWNGELALRPASGASGRVFLLYDNTGANLGTVVAVNGTGATVNGVPQDFSSGVSISIPSDWVNVLDLTTGGSSAGDGLFSGAWPLGAGALLGPADGQRGAIAYDASRDVVLVHAAATGGVTGFNYINLASALSPSAPSGPPYSGFFVNGAVLTTMINNATTVGLTLNSPSTTTTAVVPGQEHLRYLGAPGAIYQLSFAGNSATAYFTPTFGLQAHVVLGPARGAAQLTALGIGVDPTAGALDGNAFVLGAPAAGDLTEARFTGTGAVVTTSPGVGPTAAPAGGGPVLAVSAP